VVTCPGCEVPVIVYTTDLVNFPASPSTQGMEPNGWLVVGIPTNFFASASVHVVSGTLLGEPADVRFTPVGYRWNYGDGSFGYSATGGGRWASLNLPEFSATATSHVFSTTGRHRISSGVEYTAEYRFSGATWLPVIGLVLVPAAELNAVGGTARTVLVARDCNENPTGPGC
jgi:hypothetical protein